MYHDIIAELFASLGLLLLISLLLFFFYLIYAFFFVVHDYLQEIKERRMRKKLEDPTDTLLIIRLSRSEKHYLERCAAHHYMSLGHYLMWLVHRNEEGGKNV